MDLVMYRGDDRDFPLTITSDGAPLDLTDAVVVFTARTTLDATTAQISLTSADDGITIDPDQTTNAGKLIVHVPSASTADFAGTLLADLQITDVDDKILTWPEAAEAGSTLIHLKVRANVPV